MFRARWNLLAALAHRRWIGRSRAALTFAAACYGGYQGWKRRKQWYSRLFSKCAGNKVPFTSNCSPTQGEALRKARRHKSLFDEDRTLVIVQIFNKKADLVVRGRPMMSRAKFAEVVGVKEDSQFISWLFGTEQSIGLADYLFFARFLNASERQLVDVFRKFEGQRLSRREFEKRMCDGRRLPDSSMLVRRLILGDGTAGNEVQQADESKMPPYEKQSVTLSEFENFLYEIEHQRLLDRFDVFDTNQSGTISIPRFAASLAPSGKHLPVPIMKSLHKLVRNGTSYISRDEYMAVHELLYRFEDIRRMVDLEDGQVVPVTSRGIMAKTLSQRYGIEKHIADRAVCIAFDMFEQLNGTLDEEALEVLFSMQSPMSTETATLSFLENFICGAVGSGVGFSCIFPMDKVKTRIQTSTTNHGILRTFRNIVRTEGPLFLYRGLGSQLVGLVPDQAWGMACNQFFQKQCRKYNDGGSLSLTQQGLAGAGAGFAQAFTATPTECLKVRMQMQGSPGYPVESPLAVIQKMGVRGLYRGFDACVLRDVPFAILFFTQYAVYKTLLRGENLVDEARKPAGSERKRLSPTALLLAGSLSGSVAAGLATPADTVKTRLQASGDGSILQVAKNLLATEGWQGFVKGVPARMICWGPMYGISFMVFESLQNWWLPYKETANDVSMLRQPKRSDLEAARELREMQMIEQLTKESPDDANAKQ